MQKIQTGGRSPRRRHAAVAQLFVIAVGGLTKLMGIVRKPDARRGLEIRSGFQRF